MGSKFQWLLVLVLVFQAAWIYRSHTKDTAASADKRFVTLKPGQINEVQIQKPDQPVLEIIRNDSHWFLPGAGNQQADEKRIHEFLSRLLSIQSSWPIAQTQSAQDQFLVGDENFQAKIDLIPDNGLQTTIYLGRSPGINSTYARLAEEEEIYRISFKLLDLSVQSKDWLNQENNEKVTKKVLGNQPSE